MITIANQVKFDFEVGGKKDLFAPDNFIGFSIIEEANARVPRFELIFRTHRDEVIPLFNEGNVVSLIYGTDDNVFHSEMVIVKPTITNDGANFKRVRVVGVLNVLPYLNNSVILIHDKISGLELLTKIAKKYFQVDIKPEKSKDEQLWIQPNIPDYAMVNHLWMRSYLEDGVVGLGITCEGKLILRNLEDLFQAEPKWNFTLEGQGRGKDIVYNPEDFMSSNPTLMNSVFGGYNNEYHIYPLDEGGLPTQNRQTVEPSLVSGGSLSRNSDVSARLDSVGYLNENVDKNFHKAYRQNVERLAILSSYRQMLTFGGSQPVHVLDPVTYIDANASNNVARGRSYEYDSGKFIVAKVIRSISNKGFDTAIQLCRDGMNAMRGNLR